MTTIRVLAALAATLGAGVEPAPATQVRAGASAGTATDSDQRTRTMRLRIKIGDGLVTANLDDNATARDLAALLPLTVTLEDHAATEKIAYLPRKLTEEGSGPITGEAPGDLAYYAPWGNIILYYADWSYTNGLIRLGRIEGGIEPLLAPGKAAVHIELVQ